MMALVVCATLLPGEQGGAHVVQSRLTDRGGTPFSLQAVLTERGDPNEHVDVEMFWAGPDKWRRTIKSHEFSQTLIVNGEKIWEQDSGGYMPLAIQVLTTAMIDPQPILDAIRPGDMVRTKANGMSNESGRICFAPGGKMCGMSRFGLTESVGAPGRSVDFTDYHKFKGKRVARLIFYHIDPGDSWQAQVTMLAEFNSHDDSEFAVPAPTPRSQQIRGVVLPEAELRSLAVQPLVIIWPQVLEDNNTRGSTSYYISIDRTGKVREVLPLSVSVERADDSARRQIMRWKFNPATEDGVTVQSEGALHFKFDTRAYGPVAPLTNDEVRRLASDLIEPVFPSGSPSGATCTVRIAVDADGQLIEQVAVEGHEIAQTCMNAIGKWQFHPITEDGEPRPYRAEVTFRVP